MGDFNLDFYHVKTFPTYLSSEYFLYQLITSSTTNYDSLLDYIYTNIDKSQTHSAGVLESYFSDHKPIFIALH